MRLVTWNVDSIRARLLLVLAWIDEHEPDIISLQETKVPPARFPHAEFVDRGYEVVAHGDGAQGGVALLSRLGMDDVQYGIPGAHPPLDEPRSISATCGPLRVHAFYAPNGQKVGTDAHRTKLAWLALLQAWVQIDGLGEDSTVLLGDLNVAPTDLDVWNAGNDRRRNLTSPKERQAYEDLLGIGLVDVVRDAFPDEQLATWWNRRDDYFATNRGWRLDHVLADPETAQKVVSVAIDRDARAVEGASDHAPVIVDLARPPALRLIHGDG